MSRDAECVDVMSIGGLPDRTRARGPGWSDEDELGGLGATRAIFKLVSCRLYGTYSCSACKAGSITPSPSTCMLAVGFYHYAKSEMQLTHC